MGFSDKNILQEHGLLYVWNDQFEIDIPFSLIKQRIIDNFLQKWYSDINNSNRLQSYCVFKFEFELEEYLKVITDKKYRIPCQDLKLHHIIFL